MGCLPTCLHAVSWPSTGPLIRVFDMGMAFLLEEGFLYQCSSSRSLGPKFPPVIEMPVWLGRVDFQD